MNKEINNFNFTMNKLRKENFNKIKIFFLCQKSENFFLNLNSNSALPWKFGT